MIAVEHVAWQVQDPVKVVDWYVKNLGFRVLRKLEASPFTHFIADSAGRVVVEVYNNPAASVPDYPSTNPLHLHLAFELLDHLIDDFTSQNPRLGVEQFAVREERFDEFEIGLDLLEQLRLLHDLGDPAAADGMPMGGRFGGEMGGGGGTLGGKMMPPTKYNASRFAFVVQVIDAESFEPEEKGE